MRLFNKSVLFQNEAALEFLNIIKSNLDLLDTDMPNEKKNKLKHNVLFLFKISQELTQRLNI